MSGIKEDIKTRDAIDFAKDNVWSLFGRMFVPTLLGMVSMVILNLADGAFVGHGAGSEALAAINIAAPIFTIMTGIGIMFGIGSSIIASVHLAKNNVKAARINMTQALIGSIVVTGLISTLILTNLDTTCMLFGSSPELVPLAGSYLRWIAIFMPFQMLGMVGGFSVRLDGSPKFAMSCTLIASLLNIVLDYVFIFPLGMGLEGAAIATSISFSVSAVILLYYIFAKATTLKPYRLKVSRKSFALACRNLYYQAKAGFSAMLGEIAISGSMIVGNFVFIHYLGEDGVAAYSVACYCTPIIFMLANAIVQSSQPIISYAHGAGDSQRIREARNVVITSGVVAGLLSTILLCLCPEIITAIFLTPDQHAYTLAVEGMPYFGSGSLFITLNLVVIGYLQSMERSMQATVFTLLRGFILVIPAFILLPRVMGTEGIWLAIPAAELATLAAIAILPLRKACSWRTRATLK